MRIDSAGLLAGCSVDLPAGCSVDLPAGCSVDLPAGCSVDLPVHAPTPSEELLWQPSPQPAPVCPSYLSR